MNKVIVVSFMVVAGMVLGCTKAPALKLYHLTTVPLGQPEESDTLGNKTIKITFPHSAGEELSGKMQFDYGNGDSGSYQNAQWSNQLSRLLQGAFAQMLEGSGLYKTVLLDSSSAKEDYRLESTVFAFHHQVQASGSFAVASIQFTLLDMKSGNLVKSKRFSYIEATPTVDAQGYVKATHKIMKKLAEDLLVWLR